MLINMNALVQPQAKALAGGHASTQPTNLSSIRRKPTMTYMSPSFSDFRGPVHRLSASSIVTPPMVSTSSSPKLYPVPAKSLLASSKRSVGPPLPLYHPFGKLAMSLPPLDPTAFGLPVPITIDDDNSRSSSHSKRSGVKLRDAAVETDPIPPVASVSTVAAVAARETKEKASPRKKRAGGGGKRKRNSGDDGDATYPAKRTRQPRGGANNIPDDEPESPDASANGGHLMDIVSSTPGTPMDIPDKPERRTTRSRGAIARRDSTASETPSVSLASKSVVPDALDATGDGREKRRSTSKEEGEVSEESKST
ncbi:hypothetical protein J3R30DRAFT_1686079 [Lentinula aciculospora]|uniref:Uncharacterized protein n=1 Tax=Lentinula aciculospora TaxID=153920 RepID=A0A9W9DGE0_9AGAR|nr:hypothetical protein J3R30DRAFT_1686079 [Lentinula aciculospora]